MLKRSWVETANDPDGPFPLNNLPYGSVVKECHPKLGEGRFPHCCVAIGDFALDVTTLEGLGLLDVTQGQGLVLSDGNWSNFLWAPDSDRKHLRALLLEALREGSPQEDALRPHLVPLATAELVMPFDVKEYTDFYAGRHHATNVGTMFRGPENALPPNWLHIPIGYNGRASSVVVSGTDVRRPWGQLKGPDDPAPRFAPSARFDFELELGAVLGAPSEGPVTVAEADQMIFGYVLLNDWSARDIQAWEYQPLGPFQAKATATSISPWIVTAEALEAFRRPVPAREVAPLPYLTEPHPTLFDIELSVDLERDGDASPLTRTTYAEMYYSSAQQLAHHTTSGCPMRPGDLLGSGTISGPESENRGSLLELSWGGKDPIKTHAGPRAFLEDGDTVTLRGAARGEGYTIGFGECRGTVLPALDDPYARPT